MPQPRSIPPITPHNLASLLSLFTNCQPFCPSPIPRGHLFLTGAPVEVDLLGECNSGVVVADSAGSGAVCAGERNTVVDVEDSAGAAWRVDVAGSWDLVRLGVDLALGPDTATGDGGLRCGRGGRVLAEVVGAVKGTSHALIELGISVVCALHDGELESTGVLQAGGYCEQVCNVIVEGAIYAYLEVKVELAVLGLLGGADARSDVGLEPIETEGDDLPGIPELACRVCSRAGRSNLPSYPERCWSIQTLAGIHFQRS